MPSNSTRTFESLARRAVARLTLAHWFALLGRTAMVVLVIALLALVALHWSGRPAVNPWLVPGMVAGWLAVTAFWAWFRRPTPLAALALWDQRAGRHEMFASAYCFENEQVAEDGEQLHLARAEAAVQRDLPRLKQDLPAPFPHRAWLMPAALVVMTSAFSFFEPPLAAEDRPLDADARQRAKLVAEKLDDKAKTLDPLKGLTPEERKKVDQLKSSLDDTAKKMDMLEGQTPREVLAELERRARQAEELAESLGNGQAEKLSSDMIAELERHADTADLAAALRSRDAEKTAAEAEKLAARLRHKDMSLEESERIKNALQKSLQAGNRADRQGLLGRHLSQALQHLQRNRRDQAANQLSRLARQFSQLAQRQQAQRQLQQLARSLRSGGQQISGGNQSLQRLAQNPGSGLQPLSNRPLGPFSLASTGNPSGRPMAGGMRSSSSPSALSGQRPMQSGSTPVPGTGNCPGGNCPVPGAGAGQSPGSGQGQGQGQGSAQAQAPVPGSGTGGLRAGRGSAAYSNNPTARLATSSTQTVNAQMSGQGPSEVQDIAGQQHQEAPERASQEVAMQTIQAEEEALSAEPLPPARRDQVLRYFTALRRQLEQQP